MTLTQVGGVLLIFLLCPLLGGLPLIQWISHGLTGRSLNQVGTRNVGVSAAFYHGGRWVGILAVISEAIKGIAAVLLARSFFPDAPVWEVIALIALVLGRYWARQGAGTTNVVWGIVAHDGLTAVLVAIIGGVGFTIFRERQLGRLSVLVLLPMITALRHPHAGELIGAMVTLSIVLGWIYQKMPDDLDLPSGAAHQESRQVFRFFRGDRALLSLDQPLKAEQVGSKAATLSQLKRWGYPVPQGWVLPPGDDPSPLIGSLNPGPEQLLIVRSSAIGEDSDQASAAGQYQSFPGIADRASLQQAIIDCQASYHRTGAVRYRRDRQLSDTAMAVLVQEQIRSVFSGVAFSRDPIARHGDAVVIEALPGDASRVVSGQVTPEQYRVMIDSHPIEVPTDRSEPDWVLPDTLQLEMEGEGDVPPRLIQQVAYLARHLERRYQGTPQDLEWTFDGQHLWILQSRPITTLLPIWTRKIAAEVIPGFIRPLTWSINRPLTCGVWGEIFTIVLGDRTQDLDFNETATLHHSAAYFNASLLGQIFRRMGLPPESLEFLTRGARFSKPSFWVTVRNLPGLLRLVGREINLERDFEQDDGQHFTPALARLMNDDFHPQTADALLTRVADILQLLEQATYYSILSPLSAAVRQALFKVNDGELDLSHLPEVASLRSLKALALDSRPFLPQIESEKVQSSNVFARLSESPDGHNVLTQLDKFLERYGYLSDAATDIAVPRWRDDPRPVRELFAQFLTQPDLKEDPPPRPTLRRWNVEQVQRRVHLKARVAEVYNRLLAELRWSFIALESLWLSEGRLAASGDIFFLNLDEIQQAVDGSDPGLLERLPQIIAVRRSRWETDCQQTPIPVLVYGNEPPTRLEFTFTSVTPPSQRLQGIGASPGITEGAVLILHQLQAVDVAPDTVLVVPYTDSGWAPLLARASGLIAETGGRLSHGAIVAREYGIPAVMDVHNASQRLQNGQRVRIDGERGTVEII